MRRKNTWAVQNINTIMTSRSVNSLFYPHVHLLSQGLWNELRYPNTLKPLLKYLNINYTKIGDHSWWEKEYSEVIPEEVYNPPKIAIFFHVAVIGRYKNRLIEYFTKLKKSDLLRKATYIFLNYIGDEESFDFLSEFKIYNNIIPQRVSTKLEDFELPSLNNLYHFCIQNSEFNVLYIHTKGVHRDINPCIDDWVEYMTYFLINKWKLCLDNLSKYDTVGVDLRDYPIWHYSGNFWWTKSDYIKTLPEPLEFNSLEKYPNPINSLRHNQEFWICYNKGKNLTLWDSGINCYERHLHRYSVELYQLDTR